METFKKERERLEEQLALFRESKEALEEDKRRMTIQIDTMATQVGRPSRPREGEARELCVG